MEQLLAGRQIVVSLLFVDTCDACPDNRVKWLNVCLLVCYGTLAALFNQALEGSPGCAQLEARQLRAAKERRLPDTSSLGAKGQ